MNIQAPGLVNGVGEPVRKSEYPREFKLPNITIVGPRLLVLPAQRVEYQTAGGLIVPEAAQERTAKGIVLLNGDGLMLENGTRIEPRVPVGMEILFARYAGTELELDEVTYLIIQESDIRAIFDYRGNLLDRMQKKVD